MYFDDRTTNVHAHQNTIYAISGSPLHAYTHGVRGNRSVLTSNIFARAVGGRTGTGVWRDDGKLFWFFPATKLTAGIAVRSNIFLLDSGNDTGYVSTQTPFAGLLAAERNLYFDVAKPSTCASNCTTPLHDQDAVVLDPQFLDAAAGDFRLAPGSPAQRLTLHHPQAAWRARDRMDTNSLFGLGQGEIIV